MPADKGVRHEGVRNTENGSSYLVLYLSGGPPNSIILCWNIQNTRSAVERVLPTGVLFLGRCSTSLSQTRHTKAVGHARFLRSRR